MWFAEGCFFMISGFCGALFAYVACASVGTRLTSDARSIGREADVPGRGRLLRQAGTADIVAATVPLQVDRGGDQQHDGPC